MAQKVTTTNIISGPGDIYIDNVYLGATMGGVALSMESTFVDVENDLAGDAVKVLLSKTNSYVKTTLAEATLANLRLLFGTPNVATGDATWADLAVYTWGDLASLTWSFDGITNLNTVYVKMDSTTRVRSKIDIIGSGTRTLTRTFSFWAGIVYQGTEIKLSRNEAVVIPVGFRLLVDSNKTGKEYGTIIDA